MKQHKKTGFYYPDGTGSQNAISEAYFLKDYGGLPTVDFTDKVVMDCGAHIGCFSRRAIEEGAREVWAYEPNPIVFPYLQQNIAGIVVSGPSNMENIDYVDYVINSALIAGEETEIDLHYKPTRVEGASIVYQKAHHVINKKETIKVSALNFWDELEKCKPQIVKIDIEGAEWDIFKDRVLPDYVEVLFIEIHNLFSKGKLYHDQTVPMKGRGSSNTLYALEWANRIFPNATISSTVEMFMFEGRVRNVSLVMER
jgi:FkbM family methyltransferase